MACIGVVLPAVAAVEETHTLHPAKEVWFYQLCEPFPSVWLGQILVLGTQFLDIAESLAVHIVQHREQLNDIVLDWGTCRSIGRLVGLSPLKTHAFAPGN